MYIETIERCRKRGQSVRRAYSCVKQVGVTRTVAVVVLSLVFRKIAWRVIKTWR